jgi:excisionase family DNA binding protein
VINNEASASPREGKRQLLRVTEVASLLGVSRRVAYQWLATGVIPGEAIVRAGRALYVKRAALGTWLAGRNGAEPPMT